MELKDLIKKYRAIKPSQAWIERNRAKLLASYKEQFPSQHKDLFFYFKPAFAAILALFMFVAASSGLVVYAQKVSPGNQLYALKIAYEKIAPILMSANRKKVFRAEIVERRFDEVKNSIDLENKNFSSLSLQAATKELEKEIAALKKELSGEDNGNIQRPDLPVMDNQKIIAAFNNQDIDLSKILSDTKEAIKDDNIKMAVDKLGDLEKIFSATADEGNQNDQTQEVVNSDNQKNETEENQKTDSPSTAPETSPMPTPSPVIKKVSPDFKVDVNLETEKETP